MKVCDCQLNGTEHCTPFCGGKQLVDEKDAEIAKLERELAELKATHGIED